MLEFNIAMSCSHADIDLVRQSIAPSSLESTRATLMLGTTVAAGNKWLAATPDDAKRLEPESSWRKKMLPPSKSACGCSKWELSHTHKSRFA